MAETKRQLPALTDLYDGDLELKDDQNKLNILLNQPPKPSWVKDHPFAKGVKYLPIERIEFLLTRLFIKWRVEVKSISTIANSCVVIVTLHYQNIENNEWSSQDGIGAAPIQTEKNAGAMEWNKVRTDSVMKAAPAAESYAIKDAAEKIGKIFGKDLNRKDEILYDSLGYILPPEEKITISQYGYLEELIRKSTYSDDDKEKLYIDAARIESIAEYEAMRNKLIESQPKKY
ncbi:hypothetical protein LLG07_06640 [bacterium]|nr:hypothetical protein [bacterium]